MEVSRQPEEEQNRDTTDPEHILNNAMTATSVALELLQVMAATF